MSTETLKEEKRRHKRILVKHETNIVFMRELPNGESRTIPGHILDKSHSGFCIKTLAYVSKGEILKVCTDESDDCEVYFDVRWVNHLEAGYIFGCNFSVLRKPGNPEQV